MFVIKYVEYLMYNQIHSIPLHEILWIVSRENVNRAFRYERFAYVIEVVNMRYILFNMFE